jgi:hypothetical protein
MKQRKKFSSTREEAVADLRIAFASFYSELRRRGFDVVIEYDDPGNPLYIPRIVEVDGFHSDELNVRFYVESCYRNTGNLTYCPKYYFGVIYIPSYTARQHYCERQRSRNQRTTKNQLTGSALADWFEQRLAVEKRARELRHVSQTFLQRSHPDAL